MKVYLAEKVMSDGKLEPIAICSNFDLAKALFKQYKALITCMELDQVYPEGVGFCKHWHYNRNKDLENNV